MKNLFKNISVPEVITGMESKFYPVFNRYNTTGNLNITLFNFDFNENESIERNFFYNKIYGDSEYIVPASILKLFSINYFLSILDSNNLLEEKIQIGNEISKKYLNKYLFRIGMKKGQIYDIRELIELGLIPSSADVIYTLSRVIYNILNQKNLNDDCIKSKADWDTMVNFISIKIKEYYKSNLKINLSLLDPTGINRDLIQVKDIGNLVNSLIKDNSKILNVVAKSQTTKINGRTWNSTNAFVRKDKPYFYHPKIIGLKTGSLSGWKNLLLLYKLNTINFIAILVAGCENHSATKEISKIIIKELDNKLFNTNF